MPYIATSFHPVESTANKIYWFYGLMWLGLLCPQGFAQNHLTKVTPREIKMDLRALPTVNPWAPGDPLKEVSQRYHGEPILEPIQRPQLDTLVLRQERISMRQGSAFGTPSLLVDGMGFTGANPPDPVGAVGIRYFIQATNGQRVSFAIFEKSDGSLAAGPFAMADFVPCGSRGDPIVLYDHEARRWLLASLGNGASLCVLISKTPDPIEGGWWVYGFPTPNVPDYFKIGIWPNGYTVTSNEPGQPAVYALQRDAMLKGESAGIQRFHAPPLSGFTFQSLTPADWDGTFAPPKSEPAQFLRQRDVQVHGTSLPSSKADLLERFELTIDWKEPSKSSFQGPFPIEVAAFDSTLCGLNHADCIPQPEGPALDPLREVIMNRLVYRHQGTHEMLVGNFSVDVDGLDHIGIRWFELRKQKGEDWGLYQEGTFAPDDQHRWLGSPGVDAQGNLALAYQISSSTLFPGLRYSGRRHGDPRGTLPEGEFLLAEGSAANSTSRYGDYMAMTLDPIDDCTFWVTGMYNPSSNWATKIASFAFDALPAGPENLLASVTQPNEIHLVWDAVASATSYSIYRKLGRCDDSFYQLLAEGLGEPFYSDATVSAGVEYSYKIRFHGAAGTCASSFSDCISVVATGTCIKKPFFAGIVEATSANQATCGIRIRWNPPKYPCPQGTSFLIYRGLEPNFQANESNLIAACVKGTEYLDEAVQPRVTYYYQVRAEDGSTIGSGPCNGGNQDSNSRVASARAFGPAPEGSPCNFYCQVQPHLWPLLTIQNLVDCVNHPKL